MRRATARVLLPSVAALAALVTAAPAAADSPPTIAKAFSPAGIPPAGTSTLTFTIANPNATSLSGVAFSDNLPANLVVANPNGLTSTCGGTVTATAGSGSISLSGGTLAGSANCTISVNVTSSLTGTYANTTGTISSTESGGGATSNTATLTVANPPTTTKSFSTSSVQAGGTASVYFNIHNPNDDQNPPNSPVTLTGVTFTDSLPSGMTVANPASASTDCGGTITATPGSSAISFSGGTIAPAMQPDYAGGNCDIAVSVQITGSGTLNNTTGPVSANESGAGSASNTASITVTPAPQPPTLSKQFGAASIAVNGTTSLTFTVTNPNSATDLVGVNFTDPLPKRLLVANPNGLTGTCVSSFGAGATANAGSGQVSLDSLSLPASQSCTLVVNVTATAAGPKNNTTGQISAIYDSDGSGTFVGITGGSASASLMVTGPAPATLSTAFGAGAIPPGGTTPVTFNITNPNSGTGLSGVGFSDTLPSGMTIASPNGVSGSCGGGTISAPVGSATITLSGGTLPSSGSCSFSVNVTSGTEGARVNTTSDVTSNEGGIGDPASASIYIASAPTINSAFGAPSIKIGQATPLTFTIGNPNMVQGFTGLGFSDTLPAGLVVASGASDSCGGALSATPGGSTIALSGGSLPAGAGCTVVINVVGTAAGVETNKTSPVSATEGGSGNAASATITVTASTAPPPGPSGGPVVTIKGLTVHKDGSTTLTVFTSGPGSIEVLETAGSSHQAFGAAATPLKPGPGRFSFAVKDFTHIGAGNHTLHLNPGNRGVRLVRHHRGKVQLNIWVRYLPSRQSPVTTGKLHVRLP